MPAAAALILTAAMTAGGAYLAGASLMAAIAWGAASLALSAASTLLTPKPKGSNFSAIANVRTQNFRQPITARNRIYGEIRTAGPLTFVESTAVNNTRLHMIVTLAGHQCQEIGTVYFNDDAIHPEMLDANGMVISGKYASWVRIRKHLGQPGQVADPLLVAEVPDVDSNFIGAGVTYLYVRLDFDANIFPNGVPNISAQVKGALCFDPRTGTSYWNPNPALAWNDYMVNNYIGMGADQIQEIDGDYLEAAANACEEMINTKPITSLVTGYSAAGDYLDIDGDVLRIETGDRVQVTSTDDLPGGISPLTNYFVIVSHYSQKPRIKLASTYQNALAGIAVNITTSSTDTENEVILQVAPAVGDEWISIANTTLGLITGDAITLSVDYPGTLPQGLFANTTYYAIMFQFVGGNWRVRLATSQSNAMAGIYIDFHSWGTGTMRVNRANVAFPTINVNKNAEPRYTANGVVASDNNPVQILTDILTSMAGRAVYSGGVWRLFAAVWNAPTVGYGIDDMREGLTVQTKQGRRERFNAVKGTYVTSFNLGQPSDYPAVTNAVYTTQDNGQQIFTQLDLPFTNRAQTAQRVAKVQLERQRREISCDLRLNMTGMLVQAGDNLALTDDDLGWAEKSFEITSWELTSTTGSGDQSAPALAVNLGLREIDQSCFEFDETTEEVVPNPAPPSNLPNPFFVQPPGLLTLESGTPALFLRKDGTVMSRVWCYWLASLDTFVDRYEMNYKRSSDSVWLTPGFQTGNTLEFYIWDVEDGDSYDVRVRAVNTLGVKSAWVEVDNHVVIGKTEPPSDVTSLTAQQNGLLTNLFWTKVPDADVVAYEFRYKPFGPFDWDTAQPLTLGNSGGKVSALTTATNATLPPGSWTLGVKAVDSSGNFSAIPATFDIDITNGNDIIFSNALAPGWGGAIPIDAVRHDVSLTRIVPVSLDADSTADDIFDFYVPRAVSDFAVEAPELDLGFDSMGIRVYAETGGGLGPLETGGADVNLYLDYRLSSTAYDGYEPWTIGNVNARYLKFKATMSTTNGVGYIDHFTPVADITERIESGTVNVDIAGTPVLFNEEFFFTPSITVTPQGTTARFASHSGANTTGFTAHLYDAAGNPIAGVADWQAIGI